MIYVFVSQSAIEDKLDKKQWPFISDPAPINTTQTTVRWVLKRATYYKIYLRYKPLAAGMALTTLILGGHLVSVAFG